MWKICQAPGLKTKVTGPQNKRLPRQNHQRKLASFHPEFGILKIGRKIEKRPPNRVAFLRPLAAERRRGARIFVFLQRRKQVSQSAAPLRAPWALATTNAAFPATMLHWRPRMLHSQPGMPHSRPRMPHLQLCDSVLFSITKPQGPWPGKYPKKDVTPQTKQNKEDP
jgi:hypothetical protein